MSYRSYTVVPESRYLVPFHSAANAKLFITKWEWTTSSLQFQVHVTQRTWLMESYLHLPTWVLPSCCQTRLHPSTSAWCRHRRPSATSRWKHSTQYGTAHTLCSVCSFCSSLFTVFCISRSVRQLFLFLKWYHMLWLWFYFLFYFCLGFPSCHLYCTLSSVFLQNVVFINFTCSLLTASLPNVFRAFLHESQDKGTNQGPDLC